MSLICKIERDVTMIEKKDLFSQSGIDWNGNWQVVFTDDFFTKSLKLLRFQNHYLLQFFHIKLFSDIAWNVRSGDITVHLKEHCLRN